MSSEVTTVMEEGASVVLCSNFDAPNTVGTSISINASNESSVRSSLLAWAFATPAVDSIIAVQRHKMPRNAKTAKDAACGTTGSKRVLLLIRDGNMTAQLTLQS